MNIIEVIPYSSVENQLYTGDHIVDLKADLFEYIDYQDGKMVITFLNCIFNGELIIKNSEQITFKEISIYFHGCYVREIQVADVKTTNISIHFASSIVTGKIENSNLLGVSMNNTLVNGHIFLIKVKKAHISFSEENIYPRIWVKLIRFTQFRSLDEFFRLEKSYYLIDVQDVLFENMHRATNLKEGYYLRSYSLGEGHLGYYLSEKKKKSLTINLSVQFTSILGESKTRIINSYLQSISIGGYLSGSIAIENCKIREWYLRDFSGAKDASFYNIEPLFPEDDESLIEIHKSRLDTAWFDNVKFGSFAVVSFFRTKLAKASFSSCTFPSDYTSFEIFKALPNIHYPDELPENYYKDQYETFLQLRSSLESSGNFYEAQKLQAISNEALRKIKDVSFYDKLILRVNNASNSHGLSIVRPFCGFIFLSIVLYLSYLFTLNRVFHCNGIDWSLFGHYFSFIDITHKNDFLVSKNELNFFSQLIDFISKLILSFFIYQFIAAFRKYGKK